jgi:hypothetical protein
MSDLAKQYQKHTLREHIYKLPDTYIGSIENSMEEHYIVENNIAYIKTKSGQKGKVYGTYINNKLTKTKQKRTDIDV